MSSDALYHLREAAADQDLNHGAQRALSLLTQGPTKARGFIEGIAFSAIGVQDSIEVNRRRLDRLFRQLPVTVTDAATHVVSVTAQHLLNSGVPPNVLMQHAGMWHADVKAVIERAGFEFVSEGGTVGIRKTPNVNANAPYVVGRSKRRNP